MLCRLCHLVCIGIVFPLTFEMKLGTDECSYLFETIFTFLTFKIITKLVSLLSLCHQNFSLHFFKLKLLLFEDLLWNTSDLSYKCLNTMHKLSLGSIRDERPELSTNWPQNWPKYFLSGCFVVLFVTFSFLTRLDKNNNCRIVQRV